MVLIEVCVVEPETVDDNSSLILVVAEINLRTGVVTVN